MGFFEILVIAVITLLVVGPERMPEAVRSIALTIGRIKRSFNSARLEIERQIGADDIRRQLHNEEVMQKMEQIRSGITDMDRQLRESQEYDAQFEDERSMYSHSDSGHEDHSSSDSSSSDSSSSGMSSSDEGPLEPVSSESSSTVPQDKSSS